jgi:hypothetical protein
MVSLVGWLNAIDLERLGRGNVPVIVTRADRTEFELKPARVYSLTPIWSGLRCTGAVSRRNLGHDLIDIEIRWLYVKGAEDGDASTAFCLEYRSPGMKQNQISTAIIYADTEVSCVSIGHVCADSSER